MIRGLLTVALAAALVGCQTAQADLNIERLPAVQPSLPTPPTLPPPPHPTTYPDGSYSIWGARSRLRQTLNQELSMTGYIVDIYQPPDCDRRQPGCRIIVPHLWIADTPIAPENLEAQRGRQLMIVGYAERQEQIDEAVALAQRGRYVPPDPESGLLPIPTDFAVGNKVKFTGRFARTAGSGFNNSNGLLDYRSHETLEPAAR